MITERFQMRIPQAGSLPTCGLLLGSRHDRECGGLELGGSGPGGINLR
jgi:hypothetical protein